ncbi:MAG: penicillin-binding protein 2 [Candidatus Promineifilaceae bacterium]|nr:penicillin-binding protein 2 [Candidatus Promineifilaceae bacterium]
MSRIGWERVEDLELREDEDIGIRNRLYFLRILFAIILGFLLYRVWWIQQTRGPELATLASENQLAELQTDAPRGVIFDRHGEPLAINQPSFNVTITPAFLPSEENELQAVYERLSLLTGVPVTNTLQQQALVDAANPELVSTYSRLAEIYGAPVEETLDQAGVVPKLPDSIVGIVQEHSFAQYVPAVITSGIPITLAYTIEQESIYLPGVRVLPESQRDYPSGEFTSHLIGFMGPIPNQNWIDVLGYQRDDRVGWAGLEAFMELELAGAKGQRTIEQDWTGREVRQLGLSQDPVAGLNLHTTIDLELQKQAFEITKQFMEINRNTPRTDEITGERTLPEIEQAAVVAMNPQTGEILAMVNFPTFDNNRFQSEVPVDYYLQLARNDYTPLVNHAISGTYPPGSTFKLVPASGALQEAIISPERLLSAPGQIEIPNRFAPNDPGRAQTFVCWKRDGHGLMDMRQGIANSCDIYFYKISGGIDQDGEFVEGLGVDRIALYAEQFGFGRVQGVELPLEAEGNVPTKAWKRRTHGEPWSTGDDYNLGIGQGFMTATPLQVTQMAAVIANGGFLYRPTIIHHMTDEDDNVVFVDDASKVIARARPGLDGEAIVTDAEGNPLEDPSFIVEFDENGEYIYQPEVIDAVAVDREYIEIVADGMELVNQRIDDERFYTGATYIDWLDKFGISTAGKTGTSEYCDNIAIERGWCRFEQKAVQPTHAWYVGYASAEDPEIVVGVFVFNGGEGSAWAAPIACHVMAAYYGVGQYADGLTELEWEQSLLEDNRACNSEVFNPVLQPDSFAPEPLEDEEVEPETLDLPVGNEEEAITEEDSPE